MRVWVVVVEGEVEVGGGRWWGGAKSQLEGLDFSILSGNKKVQIAVQRTGQELFHGSKDTGGELVVFMKLTHSDASDASVSVEISEKYLVRKWAV